MLCVTLVSEAFVDRLGLRRSLLPEGRAPKVCLGNSDMVSLDAEVEF